ncbi:hypothetical protein BJX63DRAFT_199153 [Aspergillus granulosus]|uniref:DUF7580 domain-containing protein n=1 Tax=Aspergillus granulosus TaxID=176169 RepID=A0ABR4HG29_9EURO
MSGVEVAGLVLAILPLVVNQLDNYARGLETLRTLRRYRWELEGYSSTLSAQYAIFLNTIEIFLQEIVDDHDERSELISNPEGPAWKRAHFQRALIDKLGRDHHAFISTISGLCALLKQLSDKLDRSAPGYLKFRKILSKSVYEDILNKIDKANQILITITEQSHRLDLIRRLKPRLRKGLKRHREGRRHARALYDILVSGQGWKCPCRGDHTVCFRLDANTIRRLHTVDQSSKTCFLMMLSMSNKTQLLHSQTLWQEVEFQAELVEESVPANLTDAAKVSVVAQGKSKVQFATPSPTTVCVESAHKAPTHSLAIGDLCSTLGGAKAPDPSLGYETVGHMLNQTSDARYNMRLLRNITEDFNLYSLWGILSSQSAIDALTPIQGSVEVSRQDRLYLAAVLACSILQIHGSWLKQGWGTKDVFFAQDPQRGSTQFDHPYLVWPVVGTKAHQDSSIAGRQRVQNEILLPLAIALIELSLGRTIHSLYRVEDEAPDESQISFNTASRVLKNVYCESGSNYGDVVKECLYWSRSKGECFEDPQFDESVFDIVVTPLLKDLDYFEGVVPMR